MLLSYKKLFALKLQHDYFGGDEFVAFSLTPSNSCKNYFSNASVLYKTIGDSFIALIEEDAGKARRTIDTNLVMRLYLKFTDSFCANYTNINFNHKSGQRLYFNNKTANKIAGSNYLSQTILSHNSTVVYDPGTLVHDTASQVIYECIKTTAPLIAISDSDYWVSKAGAAYATDRDTIIVKDTNFVFNSSTPASFFRVQYMALNQQTNLFDLVARADETMNFSPDTTSQVSISMAGLSEGFYRISVNGETMDFFYDPVFIQGQYDGLIEIYNSLPGTDSFALFDASGNIKETSFDLIFNNRRSFWKYVTKGSLIEKITDASGAYTFMPNIAKSEFVSDKPIPLTVIQEKTFLIGFSGAGPPALKDIKARSPSVAMIRKTGNYYYSDINLSY